MPHDAMSVAEFGSTSALDTTVFHGLSSENGRRPPSDSPPLAVGVWPPGSLAPDVPVVLDALQPPRSSPSTIDDALRE
jgi:hypothetical protein